MRTRLWFVPFVVVYLTTIAYAWGPERNTYTNSEPSDYAVFNSITDNVALGDERNFVRIGELDSADPYSDEIEIVAGKEYEVYIYFHNDAASNTNETGYGVAKNVRVSSTYPAYISHGNRGTITGNIVWSYVTPDDSSTNESKVWDEAYCTAKGKNIILKYKEKSAVLHNSGEANGVHLPDDLFTENGTPIGYDELDGTLQGCAEYSGYITYTLVAEKGHSQSVIPIIGALVLLCVALSLTFLTLKKYKK